jgi:hypothetical protein
VDAIPPLCIRQGVRHHPHKLHADKAYESAALRQGLEERLILPRIARRGVESSEHLGRYRWVVEHQRLGQPVPPPQGQVRAARGHPSGFLTLGCALICLRRLYRF